MNGPAARQLTTLRSPRTALGAKGQALALKPPPRLSFQHRQPCAAPAFLALDVFLASPPVLLQPPPEVAMAVFVSPLVSAPQCLCNLDYADLVAPAPPLAGGHTVRLGMHSVLAAGENSIKLDTAVCLLNPVVMEENAAEILRDTAEEQALGQQMHLRMKYASEVHLSRQVSLDHDAKGQRKDKRWSPSGSRLSLLPPEVQQLVMLDLLETMDDKNKLTLEEPRVLPKPDESICLEVPDSALLTSCLASLDQQDL